MSYKVVYFELEALDLSRAKYFYETVFGWDIRIQQAYKYAQVYIDKQYAGGIVQVTEPKGPGSTRFYVEVPDIDAVLRHVSSMGAKIMEPKRSVGHHGHAALFQDPDGNVVGIWSMH
jgi:predicted enzyme related to lactoylglutathione lyase